MIIDFPPGVVSETSRRRNQVNWREANLIRWDNATLLPVGGWEKVNYAATASPIRAVHRWNDNDGVQHTAFLCETHCYIDRGDGELFDVTPIDGIAPPAQPGMGGFGDDVYGTDTYGDPRTAYPRLNLPTPAYVLDNWGQQLLAMTSADGRLLKWDPESPNDPLVEVSDAPSSNKSFIVTPERHVMLFGVGGNDSEFKWSDEENYSEWTPGTTTKAGGYTVSPAAPIMARYLTPFGILMFTGRTAYIIRHIGLPYVYNYEKIADCPPPYSPSAIVDIPDGAFWAAVNGFWIYNGVTASPVSCPIWDWIESLIDRSKSRFMASMVNVSPKFEVWFFFTSIAEESLYNDYVVIYNYKDNRWSMGKLGRNCGVSSPNDPNPIMATSNSVYKHESGWNYPDAPMPWILSHPFNSGGGSLLTTIRQMMVEVAGDTDAIVYRIEKRANPSGGATVSPPKTIRSNGFVDVRETSRDLSIRLEMVANKKWSQGVIDIDMVARGKK